MPAVNMAKSPRKRPSRQETIEKLLDGATTAFVERGFHGATLDDICARAGLTRGAFHSSFENKEQLFLALYDRMLTRVRDHLASIQASAETYPDKSIATLFAELTQDFPIDRNWYLLSSEFQLYAMRQPALAPQLAQHRRLMRETVAEALEQLLAHRGLSLKVDRDLLARLLVAIHDGSYAQSLLEPEALAPGSLIAHFGEMILRAASA
jgi:AcrR family transcriptional regulator